MAKPVKGDVVVVPFPFSDLSRSKRRPALIVANLPGDDLVLCQVTRQTIRNDFAIVLIDQDFARGGLQQPSNVRPERPFTADRRIVLSVAGAITPEKMAAVIEEIVSILRSD